MRTDMHTYTQAQAQACLAGEKALESLVTGIIAAVNRFHCNAFLIAQLRKARDLQIDSEHGSPNLLSRARRGHGS